MSNEENNILLGVADERQRNFNYNSIPSSQKPPESTNFDKSKNINTIPKNYGNEDNTVCCLCFLTFVMFLFIVGMIVIYK